MEGDHLVIQQVGRSDGALVGVELWRLPLVCRSVLSVREGLLVHPVHSLDCADVVGVLRPQVTGVSGSRGVRSRFPPWASFSCLAFSEAASWLSVRMRPYWATLASNASIGFLKVSQVVAQPHRADPSWRDDDPLFAQLVGLPELCVGGEFDGDPERRPLHRLWNLI